VEENPESFADLENPSVEQYHGYFDDAVDQVAQDNVDINGLVGMF
jgi:hypothetical protein